MNLTLQLAPQPGLLTYVTSLAPLFISFAVAVIGWFQWKNATVQTATAKAQAATAAAQLETARTKLRFDLYNRRYEILSATLDFYQTLFDWGREGHDKKAQIAVHTRFIKAMNEAEFLFDADSYVPKLLRDMGDLSMKVIGFKESGDGLKSDQEAWMEMYNESNAVILTRWPAKFEQLKAAMAPYMDFHDL